MPAQFSANIEVFLLSGVELLSDLVELARVPGRVVFLHVLQDLALVFRNARWSSDAKNMTLVFGRHLLLFASLGKQYLALMHEVVDALTHASMVQTHVCHGHVAGQRIVVAVQFLVVLQSQNCGWQRFLCVYRLWSKRDVVWNRLHGALICDVSKTTSLLFSN